MTAPKAITPATPAQTPGVVLVSLAEVHCRRLQEMLRVDRFPAERTRSDAEVALAGWRGILRAAEEGTR